MYRLLLQLADSYAKFGILNYCIDFLLVIKLTQYHTNQCINQAKQCAVGICCEDPPAGKIWWEERQRIGRWDPVMLIKCLPSYYIQTPMYETCFFIKAFLCRSLRKDFIMKLLESNTDFERRRHLNVLAHYAPHSRGVHHSLVTNLFPM